MTAVSLDEMFLGTGGGLRGQTGQQQQQPNFMTNRTTEELFKIRTMINGDKQQDDRDKMDMMKRFQERKEKFKQTVKSIKPEQDQLQQVTPQDFEDQEQFVRRTNWKDYINVGTSGGAESYEDKVGAADPAVEYDKWAQGYRMLGGYIDCDHSKSDGSHDSGGDNGNEAADGACSRWMLWAAYVNPNYQGYEYDEYFSETPYSSLDCHQSSTEWELLGVYRQEFYQYIEQISKHLWAIDEYEYICALAGLAYMTDDDCFQVGNDGDGDALYAGVQPREGGTFDLALYTDGYCIEENTNTGMTFDDFGLTSDPNLGSGDKNDGNDDGGNYNDDVADSWYGCQEYTLTALNEVYDTFRYCTPCMDYPTYQDGYFIGDYGTDDDDLINQCWKFWSHDSYTCGTDCIAKGHAQGTILPIEFAGITWGVASNEFKSGGMASSGGSGGGMLAAETQFSRLMANVFVTASFIVFVATFLAFAVARRSRHRESRSSKSRRLLDGDERSRRRRRKSHSRGGGDGVYRESSRSGKSRSGRSSRSKSARSKSKSRRSSSRNAEGDYRAPKETTGTSTPRSSDRRDRDREREERRERRRDGGQSTSPRKSNRRVADDF
eukprot:CAMPEP_0195306288 /NCGR_PEP_ID=MMETSP0707-20130614/37124_1 /TAXON_ID=33640 /ORGANISM="Asterionellopsis glacialis, Strain CCMP134" /LENGTH=605 /DNA_ID=CAMNT_0040370501 /DNA_START=283 /DNA_END=2100 /DNA_ORIENTATION=-